MKFCFFNFLLILGTVSSACFASDYPPGYAITRECQTQGPFEACLINRNQGSYPRIQVQYQGYLASASRVEINVLIKEIQNAVFFKPLSSQPGSTLELIFSDPRPGKCVSKPFGSDPASTLPSLTGEYSWCKKIVQTSPSSEVLVWETLEINPAESKLISHILGSTHVQFELAAFNTEGQWDSQMGNNYHFVF